MTHGQRVMFATAAIFRLTQWRDSGVSCVAGRLGSAAFCTKAFRPRPWFRNSAPFGASKDNVRAMTSKRNRAEPLVAAHRGLSLLRFGIPFVALLSAMLWGGWTYRNEVQAAVDRAVQNAELIGQYTERLVQTQTILQRAAVEHAQGAGSGFLKSEAFHQYLERIEKTQSFTQGLAVVALDGTMIASSQSYPVSANMGARDYLAAIAQGNPFFVDRILLEPTKADALVIVTPFVSDGFRGAIVSAVSIGIVRDFLQGIARAPDDAASLLRDDGKLLVRNVASEPMMLPPDAAARTEVLGLDRGSFETYAVADGVRRTYGFVRIGTLPLYANFGVPTATVLASWLANAVPVWALLAVIAGFTFLVGGQIQRDIQSRFDVETNRLRLVEAERLAEQRRQLVAEMNHRVKNNLSLVVALINLQMRSQGIVDGAELQARVMAISEVHEFLYHAPDADQMDFGEILTRLCASSAIVPDEQAIRLQPNIARGIIIDPDHATALALSAAEILTNAVKHAFVGRDEKHIAVSLSRVPEGALLEISDNGVGLPVVPTRTSGLRIVDGLVAQVGGTLERSSANGTQVRIRFRVAAA